MKKLTVAEYADLKSISLQAVYKKINKLNTVEEERNGRKQIFIIVDEEPKSKEEEIKPTSTSNSTPINSTSTPKDQENSTLNSTSTPANSTPQIQPNTTNDLNPLLVELLQTQLKEKDKQIEEKDKQIERLQSAADEKDKQLKEQFDRLTALLARSQELEAIANRLLTEGKDTEETEPLQDEEIVAVETPEEEDQEPENKKGFFSRIFNRKKRNEK